MSSFDFVLSSNVMELVTLSSDFVGIDLIESYCLAPIFFSIALSWGEIIDFCSEGFFEIILDTSF